MDPVAFGLPFVGIPIYWYGVMVVICILVGCFVAAREARSKGENPDHISNGLIPAIILGLIGARLYQVISSPHSLVRGCDYFR